MKPIALDSLRLQCFWDRKNSCNFRQIGVKRGVETRYLRRRRKMLPCEADDRKGRWNMKRRKGTGPFKLLQDFIVNEAVAPQLWSTVHDPMPDSDRRRHFGFCEKPADTHDSFLLTGNGRGLGEQHLLA